MRTLPLVAVLALIVAAGCKKKTDPAPAPPAGPVSAGASSTGPTVIGSTGVAAAPSVGGGGSGGAAQAVRKAVGRAVNQNEMNNIRLFIEDASLSSGKMPTAEQTKQALRQASPATSKLVEDGDIILTGTTRRESVWAYTKEPQSTAGYHLVLRNSAVEKMMPGELNQALKQ